MALSTENVIGRDGELEVIDDALDGAQAGIGRVVLIEGEAGIGKSHLLRVAASRARALSFDVCVGSGELLEQTRPFRAFDQAFGSAGPVPTHGSGPLSAADRFHRQEAIVDLVATRSLHPLLLVIDDLQWVDESSLATLAALARRADRMSLLVLAAHRPSPALPDHFVEVVTRQGGHLLRLEPLAPPEAESLATALIGARPGEDLQVQIKGAHGNPFLIIELLSSLRDEGAVVVDDGEAHSRFHGLPPTLRQTVMRRVRALLPAALDLLRSAAVLSGPFELSDAAAVLETSSVSLHPSVFAAIEAGLLAEDDTRLRLRHDLIREAIYADIPLAIRCSLHRRAAQVLSQRGAPATAVAGHLLRAGDTGTSEIVDGLQRAAAELAGADPAAAIDMLDHALHLDGLDPARRIDMRVEQVPLLASAGRLGEAEALARELMAGSAPPQVVARLRVELAEVLMLSGNAAAAVEELDLARASGALGEAEAGILAADAAWARMASFDLGGAAQDAATAEAWANEHDDPEVLTSALAIQCRLAAFGVDFERALELGRRAVQVSRSAESPAWQRTPHIYLGLSLMNADFVDEAYRVLAEGQRIAEANGAPWAVAMHYAALIAIGFHSGRWDDATAEAEAALLLHADAGTRRELLQTESLLGLMWFRRGELQSARDALARAEADFAAPGGDVGGVIWMLWLQAAFAELEGDVAEATRLMWTAFDLAVKLHVDSVKVWFAPELTRMAIATGQRDRASVVADEVGRVAARAGTASSQGAAACSAGIVGNDSASLQAGVQAYRRSSRIPDLAMACEAMGRQLEVDGRDDDAVTIYTEAVDALEAVGANHDLRRVQGHLRRLGVRQGARGARSRPSVGPESLTPAERSVLQLVGDGLANAEIAERMFISRRTVESHIGRLYAKLGVRGRVALAQQTIERTGL